MRIACWIPKATNIHSEPVILIVFPLQQWLHESAPILCYTYIDRLVGIVTSKTKYKRTVVSLARNCRLVSVMRHTIEASVWNAVRYALFHTAYHIQRKSVFFLQSRLTAVVTGYLLYSVKYLEHFSFFNSLLQRAWCGSKCRRIFSRCNCY
jgi:hypothetical protein